jgi:hypothetical protein
LGYNLALGKPATQSSTYPNAMHTIAGSAVDGNTDGEFLNKSTTRFWNKHKFLGAQNSKGIKRIVKIG